MKSFHGGPSRVNYVDEAIDDKHVAYTSTLITILYFVGFQGSFSSLPFYCRFFTCSIAFFFSISPIFWFYFVVNSSFSIPIFFPGLFGFQENGNRECFAGNYWGRGGNPIWPYCRLFHFHRQEAPRCKGNIFIPFSFLILFGLKFFDEWNLYLMRIWCLICYIRCHWRVISSFGISSEVNVVRQSILSVFWILFFATDVFFLDKNVLYFSLLILLWFCNSDA